MLGQQGLAIPIELSLEQGVLGLWQPRRWGKPLRLPATSFMTLASFKWCARLLLNEFIAAAR
jgi:hypothetical protein